MRRTRRPGWTSATKPWTPGFRTGRGVADVTGTGPVRTSGPVERVEIHPATPWWGEHRCRYRFALPYARGARVLDIACGTGFGAAMLAEAGARSVCGVDLD